MNCGYNYIQHLDFSNNSKLESLKCGGQGYEWMWRSGHVFKRLKNLLLAYDDMKDTLVELDYNDSELEHPVVLENRPELISLNCAENRLKSINLRNNKKLQRLQINDNHLTSLDLSGNPELTQVNCTSNRLDEIDISNNLLLEKLTCIDSHNENKKFTIWVGEYYKDGSISFSPNYTPYSLEKLVIKKAVGK